MESGGVYGCQKDCGGEVCSVTCVGGKCTGNCPRCGRRERRLPTVGGADAADRILKDSIGRPSKGLERRGAFKRRLIFAPNTHSYAVTREPRCRHSLRASGGSKSSINQGR